MPKINMLQECMLSLERVLIMCLQHSVFFLKIDTTKNIRLLKTLFMKIGIVIQSSFWDDWPS